MSAAEKPPIPLWRWALWWALLPPALLVFYGLFTPVWLGLRALGWLAGLQPRSRSSR